MYFLSTKVDGSLNPHRLWGLIGNAGTTLCNIQLAFSACSLRLKCFNTVSYCRVQSRVLFQEEKNTHRPCQQVACGSPELIITNFIFFFFILFPPLCISDWMFASALNVHIEGEWSYVLVCTAFISVTNDWSTMRWPDCKRPHTHTENLSLSVMETQLLIVCPSVWSLSGIPCQKDLFKLLKHPKHSFKDLFKVLGVEMVAQD